MRTLVFIISIVSFQLVNAQYNPAITAWILNTTGATGYDGIETNVQQVQYSVDNVYVSCTCIPGYDIGPWVGNPNVPANQNFVYKITLLPAENTGTLINTPLGHIGVWSNGVSIFNAKDAASYENEGIWNQNAIVVEGSSFDDCLGHPAPNGEYHHHLNPTCLYNDSDNTNHAPIIGYAFDGFPVYGAYGFANTDGTGGIARMQSSFQLRAITDRTTLADGTILPASQYGPAVSGTYPLGYYIEDYEYIAGLGDLDEHNGRFCVTPEYPDGIYAYFVTINEMGDAVYPYTLGETYYGLVQSGNTGPMSGHNTITETVTAYNSINESVPNISFLVYPNPAENTIAIFADPSTNNNMDLEIISPEGRLIYSTKNIQPAVNYNYDITALPAGIYFVILKNNFGMSAEAFVKK